MDTSQMGIWRYALFISLLSARTHLNRSGTGAENPLHACRSCDTLCPVKDPAKSGRGAVRLARLHGVQEVGGSNPLAPTVKVVRPVRLNALKTASGRKRFSF